ncbi:uncharacterized protein DS421_14g475940 [Arachis hypogaea]|nr:uncharacterized protein DS421_14g475940 [Arachis hypogaea]
MLEQYPSPHLTHQHAIVPVRACLPTLMEEPTPILSHSPYRSGRARLPDPVMLEFQFRMWCSPSSSNSVRLPVPIVFAF